MIAIMPVSEGFPILSATFPWVLVMISMFSPSPEHSKIIALYLAVKMNRESFLSFCKSTTKKSQY
jgi:hypothetical protein